MSLKLITICISSALVLISCSSKQETDIANYNPYYLSPPTFEKIDKSFDVAYSIGDNPEPEKCLKSTDINGAECTEEIWKTNLDNICNADQIDVKFAKMCVWRQFEYCDEFGQSYSYRPLFEDNEGENTTENQKFVSKTEIYNCTNYLMLEEIRNTVEEIQYDIYDLIP